MPFKMKSIPKIDTAVVFISIIICGILTVETSAFKFDIEPEDSIVPRGGSAVLHCAATSDDGIPLISWRKDGKLLIPERSDGRNVLRNGSLHIVSFNRTGESRPDEGLYQCVATLPGYGTILSRSAKLQAASLARFDEEPEDMSIGLGQTARFSCSAQGIPPPKVIWFKNDNVLVIDRSRMTILPSGSLEIRNVQSSDEGAYKCNISNVDRFYVSRTGRLVLNASPDMDNVPIFTAVPKSQTVIASESVVLECSAVSNPQPTITWLKDGVTIDFENVRFSRFGEGNLIISNAEESDRGTYQCRAQNGIDSADVSAKLDIHVAPRVISAPTNFYAYEKEDVELPCKMYGKPAPSIQWYKDGDMIIEGDYFQVVSGHSLKILGLVLTDGAMYQCIGTNPAGNVQSAVRLQVLKAESSEAGKLATETSARSRPLFLQMNPNLGQALPSPRLGVFETGMTNASFSPDGPSAPRDLAPVVVSTRFVTLTWKPPADPNGRIIAYAIVYQEVGSDRQRVFNTSRSKLEEVNVQGLQPNKKYAFRVVPYNDKGAGQSSKEIIVTTQPELDVPGPPRYVKAWPSSPTKVHVQWAQPEVTNGVILKYKVFYSEVTSGKDYNGASRPTENFPPGFKGETSDADSEDEEEDDEDYFLPRLPTGIRSVTVQTTEATLDDLRIFADYAIWITAINEKGQGGNSEQIQVTTLSAKPEDTPQNVSLETSSATSMALRWDPPPPEFKNGIITGYKIKYKQKGQKRVDTITTDGNSRFYALNNLEKGTEYQLKISALTINGTGPYTEWLTASTYQRDLDESQVPDKPESILARAMSNSITIAWIPPRNSNIMIRGYTIGWGKGIPDEYSKLVDGKRRTYTIDKLKPNSDYVISLRAKNSVGHGIPIYANIATRETSEEDEESDGESIPQLSPPVGLRAIVVSSTSVVLYWTDTSLPKTQIINDKRYYVVRYYPSPITGPHHLSTSHKKSTVKQVNATQLNTIIDGLKPGTQYEFSVKAVKGRHVSEWSLVAHNTTFEPAPTSPPQDLTLLALTGEDGTSSIILNWQPPRAVKEEVMKGYMIFYTTDPSGREWVEDSIPEDVLTHKIAGLTPDTVYHFRMAARHSKGLSPYTETKSISTPPSRKSYQPPPSYDNFPRDTDAKPSPILLYILIGVCLVFAFASVGLCIYYRKRGNEPASSPKQSSLKKQRKLELKPPDLWIHHDHMELKSLGKSANLAETPLSPSVRSSREIGDAEEKIPLQHNTNSLDKRNFMSSYIGEQSLSNQCHSLGRRRPKPIRIPVEPFNFKADVGGGGTADLRSNPLFQRNSQSQSQLRPVPLTGESPNGQHIVDGQKTYDSVPSGSSAASSQNNLNSLVHYGSGSEYGTQQSVTALGTLGRRSGANLKSFAVPVPPTGTLPHHPTTPQQNKVITARPVGGTIVSMSPNTNPNIQNSPIKRISTSQFPSAHPLGYQQPMPPSPRHYPDTEPGSMQKCYSTEELSQEISNLEGLMKDLNAITANEFQC